MAGSIPSRRASFPGATRSAGSTTATGHAGGPLPTGNATDDQPKPGDGGMPDLPPVISHGAISPPGGMPTITLVKPSYKEACKARDASRERFENHPPGSDVSQGTVRSDTNHLDLGQTVATVRNYLNATIAASDNTIDALNTTFQSAARHGSDIAAPLQELETLLNKADQMVSDMKADNPADTDIDDASKLIREAKSQLVEAQDPHTDTDQRCNSALNALRSLGQATEFTFNRLEDHMQEAEDKHQEMTTAIIAKPANLLFAESAPILRCLDHVLQNGDGAKSPPFNMDDFIQQLYNERAIGSTLANASAHQYTASSEDIGRLLSSIEVNAPDLHTIATKTQTDMFASGADRIDIKSYLDTIITTANDTMSPAPNAAELLKEALKYIRPER